MSATVPPNRFSAPESAATSLGVWFAAEYVAMLFTAARAQAAIESCQVISALGPPRSVLAAAFRDKKRLLRLTVKFLLQ
ncbi:hypothetical protein ABIB57_002066 [Devosia sp. UYZn731]|uniref:hypothetical protein n=1 Tax=Devosia sp. UYZn731 TaxID=3156345 RepID=UPI00339234B7